MILIIDYGVGNLRSVTNAFEAIGEEVRITRDPTDLAKASAIVLPGVGAFGDGMENLRAAGFVEPLREEVVERKRPFLGICLGMQFLAERSYENGCHEGLGYVRGVVERIAPAEPRFRVPHMGWNDVRIERRGELLGGLPDRPVFYFVHSYHLHVAAEDSPVITSTCWHGTTVTASVEKENIFGVQFHPEKSQEAGLQVLKNFVAYAHRC